MEEDLFGVCPVTTACQLVSGKWTLLILYNLSKKTMRFNELHKEVGGVTQSILAKQLRTMEENELIIRTMYTQIPPKVEYSLSDIGKQFITVLDALEDWGNQYITYLKNKE